MSMKSQQNQKCGMCHPLRSEFYNYDYAEQNKEKERTVQPYLMHRDRAQGKKIHTETKGWLFHPLRHASVAKLTEIANATHRIESLMTLLNTPEGGIFHCVLYNRTSKRPRQTKGWTINYTYRLPN